MATSFLDKTGLTQLWAKIKSTFALKSEVPDSTSDLTNDSGFIDSARLDITLTSHWDSATDTTTYTADKTYSEISAAIASGKIPYAKYSGSTYKYDGVYENEIAFSWEGISSLVDGQGHVIETYISEIFLVVDNTNTWARYDDSDYIIASKTSQLTNDSGFITSSDVPQSDWNQNNSSASDYIKNRVCYTGNPVMTVVAQGTIPAGGAYYGDAVSLTDAADLLDIYNYPDLSGMQYSATLGGTTYTGTVYSEDQDGWFWSYVGNPYLLNSESYQDNGMPFAYDFYSYIIANQLSEETSFSLSLPVSPVYKLDDKYLNGSLIKRGTGLRSIILNGEDCYLDASGDYSVAEGNGSISSGYSSHAEGYSTASGDNSHAEGSGTQATGFSSHAEGSYAVASGGNAHAEGGFTKASGDYSHAEGTNTESSGGYSHAENNYTISSGQNSHAEGTHTVAAGISSHAEGGYSGNVQSVSFAIQLTGVANATTYTLVNTLPFHNSLVGFRVGNQDNVVVSETTNSSGVIQTITLNKTLSSSAVNSRTYTIYNGGNAAIGTNSHAEGYYTSASGYASHTEGYGTYANHRSQHVFGEWNIRDNSSANSDSRGTFVEIVGNGAYNSKSNARTLDWNGNEVLAGKLTVGAAPTANMDVATKLYVDTAVAGAGGGGSSEENNPTLETEWVDVYSDWAAGYYYDPNNDYAYTQIPSTETTWGVTETYLATSCTPYTNLIPVKSGEEWRYNNMPIHFDSTNSEIPSIIIFDSNKDEVEAYTRTFQDEYTEFTIPSDGVWMAVMYANSQDYVLQKKVAKRLDKDAILDSIKADYRAYSLTPAPTPRTLTKAYICLGTDDLRGWEVKNLHTMFTTNGIPYYMAAIPDNIKQCVTDDPYKTNLDYMRLCVAAGGEIICHSGPVITELNKNDFDTMYTYFCKNKEQLEYYGFKVRGIFKAGGEGAIYDAADPDIDAWAVHYYDFGDYFTTSFPYALERTLLDDWADYSYLATAIQDAVQNHTAVIGAFHYYNANAELAISTIMSALSNYTEGVDYEFVTPSQMYELMMPTSRPSGGGSGGASYGISISNNIITLTGSDGTTSSVTLPVYAGGVSP